MLSYQNIKTVALYEKKTLMRSWFFKIFAILAIIGITIFHILTTADVGMTTWAFRSIPGNIPYSNLKYLNIIQSVIAVFLASGFLKRDKKFDTSEVIYVRPMSNAEYILGKTLGIFKVFMGLNIISLTIAFIINTIGADTPLDISTYLIYPLIISIPSIIFILGLSFVLMVLIKNQPITFLILLGYIGLCVFYFGSKFNGLLDYTSFQLPLLHSDIIGFGNLSEILFHRGAYLLLGLGFICLTIIKISRLPHSPAKIRRYLILAIIFLISGSILISHIALDNKTTKTKRIAYRSIDSKYYNTPTVEITDIDIELIHEGENIKCNTKLTVKNNTSKNLNSFIISLNPGLIIDKLTCNNESLKRERKEHVIIISPNKPINVGEKRLINISYSGNIDETLCYRDIENNKYDEPYISYNFNIDKRFAFLNKDFLLLTPEALWYPVAGIRYNSQKPIFGKYHFSNYSLKVKTDKKLTAISQGKHTRNNKGEFSFKPEIPLTQISLAIGKFEQKKLIVDSLEIRLLHFQGHDYFSHVFEEINDTIPSLIREFKNQFELEKKRDYPFKRLTLVEVPVQFKTYSRLWTTLRETVQPEMVLLPESGITLPDGDFSGTFKRMKKWRGRGGDNVNEKTLKINLFNRAINQIFKSSGTQHPSISRQVRRNTSINVGVNISSSNEGAFSLNPYFYTFTNNITSSDFPIVNTLFESLLTDEKVTRREMFRSFIGGLSSQEIANIYLSHNSFKDILTKYNINSEKLPAIIENKANYLKAILTNNISEEEFKDYISGFLDQHKYKNTTFDELLDTYNKQFDLDLSKDVHNWYYAKKSPGYIISELTGTKIIDKDSKKYQLSFTVKNPEPQSGIINVSIMAGNMGFGRRMSRNSSNNTIKRSYYINGNSNYEIGIVCSQKPIIVKINTLTSQNIPASITSRFDNYKESTKQAFNGMKKIKNTASNNSEIIVDNEDSGFSTEENIKEIKLKKLFKKKEVTAPDEKYEGTNFWRPPIKWTLTSKGSFYGKYIRSAYYIKGGDGKQKASWKAEIEKSGYYDIYFFKQKEDGLRFVRGRGRRSDNFKNPKNNYDITVYSDDGADNIELNLSEHKEGWLYLGSYYLSSGEAKVVLSNKSDASIVYADAIKWVKKQ